MEYFFEKLSSIFNKRVQFNISANNITSYKTGGPIKVLVYPKDIEELFFLFKLIKDKNLKFFICGRATNILVSDFGFDGIFIKTDLFNNIQIDGNTILVESGFLWDKMIEIAVLNGFKGLEKTSYIPGSVGGAIRMNAGAFGQETFDRLQRITVVDIKTVQILELSKSQINYGYRKVSGIEDYFILKGEFLFERGDVDELKKTRDEIIKKRFEKQPLEYPSAGSVFKRPPNDYASRLIEESGLKGFRVGGAMVSEKHAGFIINTGNATSSDIYNIINIIKEKVYQKTGIILELEQILVGDF